MSSPVPLNIYRLGAVPPISENVSTIENEFHESTSREQVNSTDDGFPQRPQYGKKGKLQVVWTNYVEMELNPRQGFVKYKITVEPKATGRKLHRVIELLLNQPWFTAADPKRFYFSDFKSTLLLHIRSPKEGPDSKTFNIIYFPEDEDGPGGSQSAVYHVRLQEEQRLGMTPFNKHIDPRNGVAFEQKEVMVQAINIMLKQHSKDNPDLVVIGDKIFAMAGAAMFCQELHRGLQAYRGVFISLRIMAGRICVNVNVAYGVFYKSGSLIDLMAAFGMQDKETLAKFLKFLRVKKMHLQRKKQDGTFDAPTRTIIGLATPNDGKFDTKGKKLPNPPIVKEFGAGPRDVKFWYREEYISVHDYFESVLGIKLRNSQLPVVNVGSVQTPFYLPPEQCSVPRGQHAPMSRVTLDASQTTIMLRMTVKKPAENFQFITDHALRLVGLQPTPTFLNDNFVRIRPGLLTVPARVLTAPQLKCQKEVKVREASWNMRGHSFHHPGRIESCRCLYLIVAGYTAALTPQKKTMHSIQTTFRNSLTAAGIQVAKFEDGKHVALNGERDGSLEQHLRSSGAGVKLLWIIVPKGIKLLYDRIKHIADVKIGIATVVSQDYKLNGSGLQQYFGNEALKINLKFNGRNLVVDPSRTHFIQDNTTMVVGIDVTHPSTDQSRGGAPSVASMVANVDKHLATWYAALSIQKRRQEKVSDLDEMLKSRLEIWKARHNLYPRRILVYRDGVSEGQYKMVRDEEKALLLGACEQLYRKAKQTRPEITIIIVAKRHHTRFAPTAEDRADSTYNCPAGTVVDRGITSPTLWQFFLQAHTTLQGSARPGFYSVIWDETFRKASQTPAAKGRSAIDMCEDITQSLCYTFGRATRAVGIVAPAYFADIVCTRAVRYLNAIAASSPASQKGSLQASSGSPFEISLARQQELQKEIETHVNLKETMFFI